MRIFLFALCFSLSALTVSGQQFSHYNTGTLYEGFENPAVKTFTPDSSRRIAFNWLIPSVYGSFYINGNSQSSLKGRAFNGRYNSSQLRIGEGAFNRVSENANIYFIQFKIFSDLESNSEFGFSVQSREEGTGKFSDESVALFSGAGAFENNSYTDVFNNRMSYQSYHQISFTYRENINKDFALGFKLSGLLGIQHQKINITSSSIEFDRPNDRALLQMAGTYVIDYTPGQFTLHDNLPHFRNPGASISIGTTYRTRDNFNLQANLKDLGFIRWNGRSATYNFDSADSIKNLSGNRREDNIYSATYDIIHTGGKIGAFVTPTNAKVELSANKNYWFGEGRDRFRYSPTIIALKELFYNGLALAMVNPVSYKNLTLGVTSSYNQYKIFSMGGQFMVKSPNAEFFIGSEKLIQSGRFLIASTGNDPEISRQASYTGADIFLGVSFKFGDVIEHPMNANNIPMGENKSFFSRLWQRLFNHGDD